MTGEYRKCLEYHSHQKTRITVYFLYNFTVYFSPIGKALRWASLIFFSLFVVSKEKSMISRKKKNSLFRPKCNILERKLN